MTLSARLTFPESRGEAAYLRHPDSDHLLEVNWYAGDSPVAGPYREGEELDHLAFRVENLDDAMAFLAAHGYPKEFGPIESEAARWSYVRDPDGIWVEVYEMKRPRPRSQTEK